MVALKFYLGFSIRYMLNNLTSNSTKSQAASQRERSNTQGRLQSVIHPNQQLQKKVDKIYQPKKPFFFFFFFSFGTLIDILLSHFGKPKWWRFHLSIQFGYSLENEILSPVKLSPIFNHQRIVLGGATEVYSFHGNDLEKSEGIKEPKFAGFCNA